MDTRQVTLDSGRTVTISGPVTVITNRSQAPRLRMKSQFRVSRLKVGDVPQNFTRRISRRELAEVNS